MVDIPKSLEIFRASLDKGAGWITGEVFHRLIDAIIEDRAKFSEQSATLTKHWDGREFNILAGAGAAGGSGPGGFKCAVSDSGDRIRVYYGTVNSLAASGMVPGDTSPLTLSPDGADGQVYVAVTAGDTGGGIWGAVSVEVQCFHSPPADETPENTFYQACGSYAAVGLGLVVTPGGAGQGIGDQRFELCGGAGGAPQWGPA